MPDPTITAARHFADELRKWWSFDDRQQHTHSWHSREDFIEKKLPSLLAARSPADDAYDAARNCAWDVWQNRKADTLAEFDNALQHAVGILSLASRSPAPADRAEIVEECARLIELIGADWRDTGIEQKFYASEYLAKEVRSLSEARPKAAAPLQSGDRGET